MLCRDISGADGFAELSPKAAVLFLMIVNWSVESCKWRYMINKIEKISFIKSLEAVFTGISVSIFTPNRVGEYFGRVFILEKASHIEGILITILGSMSQLLITILTGTIAFLVFIPEYFSHIEVFSGYLYYGMVFIITVLDILLLILYFNVSFLSSLREKLLRFRLKKFRKYLNVFSHYHLKELTVVIFLSFLRYMIFSYQYYLLLRLFGISIPLPESMVLISLIFFIITVFPTFALTELGIRDTAALYFFGLYFGTMKLMSDDIALGIFAASTLLWIVNLAIPAVIGTIFVFRLKFFRKIDTMP